jgi:alkylhydroperoxidase family enzyme
MAWIETIDPRDAEGALKAEYDAAVARAGKVYQILRIQSLNPATLHHSMALYKAAMHGASGLSRVEREMLATVVSRANDCFY